jgi:hypothetical protein
VKALLEGDTPKVRFDVGRVVKWLHLYERRLSRWSSAWICRLDGGKPDASLMGMAERYRIRCWMHEAGCTKDAPDALDAHLMHCIKQRPPHIN